MVIVSAVDRQTLLGWRDQLRKKKNAEKRNRMRLKKHSKNKDEVIVELESEIDNLKDKEEKAEFKRQIHDSTSLSFVK